MENVYYKVIIEAAKEGGFVATVPAIPGCHTQGETLDETAVHLKEAVEAVLISYIKRGKGIPVDQRAAQSSFSIQVKPPQLV
jgi:antitoxin HicB